MSLNAEISLSNGSLTIKNLKYKFSLNRGRKKLKNSGKCLAYTYEMYVNTDNRHSNVSLRALASVL